MFPSQVSCVSLARSPILATRIWKGPFRFTLPWNATRSPKGDQSGDPLVDDLIQKSKIEPDNEARIEIMHELQRHCAEQMYIIRALSGATSFELAWPAIRNYLYFRGARRSEEVRYFWLDKTQPPEA